MVITLQTLWLTTTSKFPLTAATSTLSNTLTKIILKNNKNACGVAFGALAVGNL